MRRKVLVTCSNCGTLLAEDYYSLARGAAELGPCPKCGSAVRTMHVSLQAVVHLYANLKGVLRKPGFKRNRPAIEFLTGIVPSVSRGWVKIEQRIDRLHSRYRKRVETLDSDCLRDTEEPLDQHIGYGSAKFKAPSRDENATSEVAGKPDSL